MYITMSLATIHWSRIFSGTTYQQYQVQASINIHKYEFIDIYPDNY